MEKRMLCYQCESTANGKCCNDDRGICGKTAETSHLQDVLTGALVGLAKASVHKSLDGEIQRLTVEGLCATAAHANFADARLLALIDKVRAAKKRFTPKYGDHNAGLSLAEDYDIRLIWQKSPDLRSLKSLLLFGIRGSAGYALESWALGYPNRETATFFHKALITLSANHFKEDYFALLKEMGEVNLRAMELLDKAKNETYGEPRPVEVSRVIDAGPFIVVGGHHYHELMTILEQTADTGINVYSHGELLSAHAYPAFGKYPHFKGHYGTGWQNQQAELAHIPAAVVFTSNCLMLPLASYADRVFTCGTAGLPGIPHIDDGDFRPVLIRSIELGGAAAKTAFPGANGGVAVTTGFGGKSLQTLGYKIAGAMADGDILHIFVIGGCDGFGEDRQFFTDIIRRLPDDAVVLTYGCCKFRFNDMERAAVGGVPKIIDVGQCGDLLHIIQAVKAIAAAAQSRLEELPLTWLLSWQEQRSMANLFSLFAADIHNVILGPKRPPFFTEAVLKVFAEEFSLSILMEGETCKEETPEEGIFPGEAPEKELLKKEDFQEDSFEEGSCKEETPQEAAFQGEILEEETVKTAPDGEETGVPGAETLPPRGRAEAENQTPAAAATIENAEGEAPEAKKAQMLREKDAAVSVPAIPKGKGVSGWQDPDESPSFPRKAAPKPYVYTPRQELKEIPAPPPLPLPLGAGVSGFSSGQVKADDPPPMENMYSFAEAQPEIKIPKGKGVSGWKETDQAAFTAKKSAADGEESSAKPWLEKSLKELKASLAVADDNAWDHQDTAPPEAAATRGTPAATLEDGAMAAAETEAAMVEDDAVAATEAATPPLLDEEERQAKPWLEKSLQELKASLAEDEEAKKADGKKPWLAASLKQLKESLTEDGDEPAASQATTKETVPSESAATTAALAETGQKPPLPPKPRQDSAGAPPEPSQSQSQPSPGETDAESEPPQRWQKPPVAAKPWERDLGRNWQKPATVPKPWQQQVSLPPNTAAEPIPSLYTQLPNLPLGNPRMKPVPPGAAANPLDGASRQPAERIPGNAGISGDQPAAYGPGQIPPASTGVRELREVMAAPPAEIPYGAGVSGVRYRDEEPPLSPSYDPTYYDVPQKTPKLNLPKGVGVSGWQNGEAPLDAAAALRSQGAEKGKQAFTAGELLALADDTSSAAASEGDVYRPGQGEELIATLGPDGKVILAVRNKNKD